MQFVIACIVSGVLLGFSILAHPFSVSAETVKTYVKQYSIFTFDQEDYLCEPYQVQKNDWLYKIFRTKGEISAQDFPRFLKIFRQLNPKLSNIDAIEPGHQILIPLKAVSRKAYEPKTQNIVEVPVLEFSEGFKTEFKNEHLRSFVHPHIIQPGDTISDLLDRSFRPNGGPVSDIGKKIFYRLNPGIKDIDRVYLGSRVTIPEPAILVQPWLQEFLRSGRVEFRDNRAASADQPTAVMPALPGLSPDLSQMDLMQLKRYAQLIEGTLQHQGQMIFPGKGDQATQVLDLSKTPVLTHKNGRKDIILPISPGKTDAQQIGNDLLKGIRAYWKEIQIQELNKALASSSIFFASPATLDSIPEDPQALIQLIHEICSAAGLSLQPPTPVSVDVGAVSMDISLARIIHPDSPDILINPGTVFGMALHALEEKGYQMLTLSPDMTGSQLILELFSKLGYATWKNPAVNTGDHVTTLQGIYAARQQEKWFVTRSVLSAHQTAFLKAEGVNLIQL